MDMEPSEAEPYVLEETSTTVAPVALREIPQDIIDEILDHLTADNNSHSRLSLLSCSLVSKSWVTPCRRHLFRTAYFTWRYIAIWLETFPVPEESPAHHVRELCFWCGWCFDAPEKFFEYIPWFTGVRKIVWSGQAELEPLCRILSSGRLSQSVTSLAIYMDSVTVLQIRDVMDRLPNLNDLSLSGSLVRMDKNKLIGIGTGLRGKFGGRLRLLRGHVDTGIVNMLLEVPAGLHFTEVYIHSASERLRPTLRLTEACAESLAKLTYTVDDYNGHEAFNQSLNFAKFPSLEELELSVDRTSGGLLWIATTLSTLKPVTSPHLSIIRLEFSKSREWFVNDLLLFKNEVVRIRSEFAGTVNLSVKGYPAFER